MRLINLQQPRRIVFGDGARRLPDGFYCQNGPPKLNTNRALPTGLALMRINMLTLKSLPGHPPSEKHRARYYINANCNRDAILVRKQ